MTEQAGQSTWRSLAEKLRARVQDRPDTELEQATIRLILGSLCAAYLLLRDFLLGDLGSATSIHLLAALFLSAAAALFVGAVRRPQISPARRYLGMALDLATASAVLVTTGEAGTPLFGVYLWVTMGNGFRYGRRYLIASTAMSLLGFSAVLALSDYWRLHTAFGSSLMILLLAIPLYMGALLNKLNAAIHRAQEASNAKSQFLAKMSHELRTPLNGVIGLSDILIDSRIDQKHLDIVRSIQSSATTLLKTIEAVLDFSKIEAGRVEIESTNFDLHHLVSDTIRIVKPQATQKGLNLTLSVDPHVPFLLCGDPFHIRQVLTNLLSNAVKFTEHGNVSLRVISSKSGTIPASGCRVRFEVEDTGIGIPLENQKRVFQSFQQADSSMTRRFGGTGLGTTIARELVRLMDGEIGLHSEPGRGSLFWFDIPLTRQPSNTDQPIERFAEDRVLVVGKGTAAEALCAAMTQWGIPFVTAWSPSEAFAATLHERPERRNFSVILVVAGNPEFDPATVAAGLRDHDSLRETALILVNADPVIDDEETRRTEGYTSILFSPLDRTLLFNLLHATHTEQAAPANVISLADHYRRLAARPDHKLHILIAEDNETNRHLLQEILQRVGHEVVAVDDGEKALDVLEKHRKDLDLMILDMNMPNRGGLEVFQAYRFMARRNPIPTIILTADATENALTACKEAKVDAYLTKPLDTRRLLATIATLSDQSERRDGHNHIYPEVPPKRQEPKRRVPAESPITPLVDETKLHELLTLGIDRTFFEELVSGFLRDGDGSLAQLASAIDERDYPRLRNAIHALQGSAGELGATRIVAVCGDLKQLKPFELGSPLAHDLLEDARQAFSKTSVVLTEFAQKERDAIT